jgi:hypothetical protein
MTVFSHKAPPPPTPRAERLSDTPPSTKFPHIFKSSLVLKKFSFLPRKLFIPKWIRNLRHGSFGRENLTEEMLFEAMERWGI